MTEQNSLRLKQVWLMISGFSLLLPVFMPSSANPNNFFESGIGTVTVTMFILSFPSSLFGLPVMMFAQAVLGVGANSIEGLYLNLFLMFVFGSVQWFWILPKLVGESESKIQALNLLAVRARRPSANFKPSVTPPANEWQWESPLERVINEKNTK